MQGAFHSLNIAPFSGEGEGRQGGGGGQLVHIFTQLVNAEGRPIKEKYQTIVMR